MAELLKTKRQSSAMQSARVERILEIATDNELKKVEKNFTYLATIGSTAPFIGLFGTVWGLSVITKLRCRTLLTFRYRWRADS